jgi:peptidoglycan/LPS O-acetylase OafA/YrhL
MLPRHASHIRPPEVKKSTQVRDIAGFDYLRVLAIFSVVWIHGCDTNWLARQAQWLTAFAVPSFVFLTAFLMYLSVTRNEDLTFKTYIIRRIVRLVPAFVVWSALYVIARSIKGFLSYGDLPKFDWVSILFTGGASYQLYFVPTVLYLSLLFLPLALVGRTQSRYFAIGTGALAMACLSGGNFLLSRLDEPSLFTSAILQYTGYFPLAFSLVSLINDRSSKKLALVSIVSIAFVLILYQMRLIPTNLYVLLLAVLVVTGLFSANLAPVPRFWKNISIFSFGIYLCHAFFIEGLQWWITSAGIEVARFEVTLAVILLSFFLSVLACNLITKLNRLRFLVV